MLDRPAPAAADVPEAWCAGAHLLDRRTITRHARPREGLRLPASIGLDRALQIPLVEALGATLEPVLAAHQAGADYLYPSRPHDGQNDPVADVLSAWQDHQPLDAA